MVRLGSQLQLEPFSATHSNPDASHRHCHHHCHHRCYHQCYHRFHHRCHHHCYCHCHNHCHHHIPTQTQKCQKSGAGGCWVCRKQRGNVVKKKSVKQWTLPTVQVWVGKWQRVQCRDSERVPQMIFCACSD